MYNYILLIKAACNSLKNTFSDNGFIYSLEPFQIFQCYNLELK